LYFKNPNSSKGFKLGDGYNTSIYNRSQKGCNIFFNRFRNAFYSPERLVLTYGFNHLRSIARNKAEFWNTSKKKKELHLFCDSLYILWIICRIYNLIRKPILFKQVNVNTVLHFGNIIKRTISASRCHYINYIVPESNSTLDERELKVALTDKQLVDT